MPGYFHFPQRSNSTARRLSYQWVHEVASFLIQATQAKVIVKTPAVCIFCRCWECNNWIWRGCDSYCPWGVQKSALGWNRMYTNFPFSGFQHPRKETDTGTLRVSFLFSVCSAAANRKASTKLHVLYPLNPGIAPTHPPAVERTLADNLASPRHFTQWTKCQISQIAHPCCVSYV